MAKILDGKIVRDKIAENLKKEISTLSPKPKLVIIQVGENPQSNTYIKQKVLFGEKIGAIVEHVKLPEDVSEKTLNSQISTLNSEKNIHGIILQLPIPKNLNKDKIIETISPQKDVDGQNSVNIKKLMENDVTGHTPATTKGILTLLDFYQIPISGKHVVIVGRSSLVGKPTAFAMLNFDATVTIVHSKTKDLEKVTKSADILVVAVGKPNLITKNHVLPNQTIVDVGINVIENSPPSHPEPPNRHPELVSGSSQTSDTKPENEPASRKLVGDVSFEAVSKIVKAISPVPGGVGPLTVASLFQNLLQAYKVVDG